MSGRPVGTGYQTIRLADRNRHTCPQLFIGRALYQQLGCPTRVRLSTRRANHRTNAGWTGQVLVLSIAPASGYGHEYSVTGPRFNGIPRISIGVRVCEALGLVPGTYAARVTRDGRIAANLVAPIKQEV